ncbi:hypothetical protein Y695_04913 [Hydrogenophaga sp. T4]|nr:hypothetical protein Y695_04913 [Hydrogenophaga sp. T4]
MAPKLIRGWRSCRAVVVSRNLLVSISVSSTDECPVLSVWVSVSESVTRRCVSRGWPESGPVDALAVCSRSLVVLLVLVAVLVWVASVDAVIWPWVDRVVFRLVV